MQQSSFSRGYALALLLLLLFWLAPLVAAAVPQVLLNGELLPLTPAPLESAGSVQLPLRALALALGGEQAAAWEGEVLDLKVNGQEIRLREGATEVEVNGSRRRLSAAVLRAGEDLYLPASLVAELLGYRSVWDEEKHILSLEAPLARVEALSYAERDGRPGFSIVATRPLRYEVRSLANPPRLVVDLYDARLAAGDPPVPGNSAIRGLRARQFAPTVVRVVADLVQPVSFAAERDPARPQQLNLRAYRVVTRASFSRTEGQGRLTIQGSAPLVYEVKVLESPPRLVVDLPQAVLQAAETEQAVDDPAVAKVRLSQFQPDLVRVVLDLKTPLSYRPVLTEDSRQVALELLDQVVGLQVEEVPGKTRVIIETTGATAFSALHLTQPERLAIDILGAAVSPQLQPVAGQGEGPVRQVRAAQFNSETARVVVDLTHSVGYQVVKEEGSHRIVVEINRSAVLGKRIVVDPGHGGADPGAFGRSGLREKDVNLDLGRRLAEVLQNRGAEVFLTRSDDTFVPLYDRAALANAQQGQIFVSLHANSFRHQYANGSEMYYYPGNEKAKRLAELISDELTGLGLANRAIKANKEFVVVREPKMPAVLVEVAFLSNPDEEKLLADAGFRQQAAEAIARGIERYFQEEGRAAAAQ
ncbi:MAG: N-acetylmuramoyl-L-alanine amidase [Bacillota bacterium]|nr:N-acetylmuramoyl-L-alanine amidase [Bacillota bacterium]